MTDDDLFASIKDELLRASGQQARQRRRRKVAALAIVPAVLVTSLGVAAVVPHDPLDIPLPSFGTPTSDKDARVDLHVALPNQRSWTVTAYRSSANLLCATAAADGQDVHDDLGCAAGFVLADGFAHADPLSYSVADAGPSLLVYGVTPASTHSIGSQQGQSAIVSTATLRVPISTAGMTLTDQGQAFAKTLPADLEVRPFTLVIPATTSPTIDAQITDNSGATKTITLRVADAATPPTP